MDWQSWIAAGVSALVGGALGAWAVLHQGTRDAKLAVADAEDRRRDEEAAAERRFQREMLFRGSDRLLLALWRREVEVAEALHVARTEGSVPAGESEAHPLLSRIDHDFNEDMITALPYLPDPELRGRIATARTVVNDCFNLRAAGAGASYEQYSGAMVDVQGYFDWLRWNIVCALNGDDLPPALDPPKVRETPGSWQNHLGKLRLT